MKKALCTGSNGFVGRHMVQRLLKEGYHVTGWDNLSSGLPILQWPKGQDIPQRFVTLDVRDLGKRGETPDDFDLIIHCAAVVGGRLKIEGDPLAVATDLAIDATFFNWAVRAKNKPKVIYFSSSAVYPVELQTECAHVKLVETLVNFNTSRISMPDQTYGFAKLAGEYLAQCAAKQYGLDVVIYRPFSGYGPDQSFNYPFPSIIRRAVRREDPFVIWGSGNQVRDFIHIDDVVDAVFATKDILKPGEVLNLGSGRPVSFKQLAQWAIQAVGYNAQIICDISKPEGVFYRVADTYKLQQLHPMMHNLGAGIEECVKYLDKEAIPAVV